MHRREFLQRSAALAAGLPLNAYAHLLAEQPPDVSLTIAPFNLDIAPGKTIRTVAYNGQVPGPLIRWPENKPITIDVLNQTQSPEIVHWHGLWIPSNVDGAMEEGSPMIAPGARLRYQFTPQPAGFRWYHTHTSAGRDLRKATYTGQFGCFFIEPAQNPGRYDQEIFLTLHDWNGYMGGGGDASMDVVYDYATINDRMLGAGDPIRVHQGQRILLHILNASATLTHCIALPRHRFQVTAMDGNPVPTSAFKNTLCLAPAERIDALVEMNEPGVWILGETREPIRKSGLGIVVEYAGQSGPAQWITPPQEAWDYAAFAASQPSAAQPDKIVPLVFRSKFAGHGDFDHWTINGKSFPHVDPVVLRQNLRYRLQMQNASSDDHPVHLHRHTFQVTSIHGAPVAGLMKDVVVVKAGTTMTVDFAASNPGPTLFHCHQQSHMDNGFMMLFRYA